MRALPLVVVLTACSQGPNEEVATSAVEHACSAVDRGYEISFLTTTSLTDPFLTVAGDVATYEEIVVEPRDRGPGYRNQRPGTLIATSTVTSCEVVDDAYRARQAEQTAALAEKNEQLHTQNLELLKQVPDLWRTVCDQNSTDAHRDRYDCSELPPE